MHLQIVKQTRFALEGGGKCWRTSVVDWDVFALLGQRTAACSFIADTEPKSEISPLEVEHRLASEGASDIEISSDSIALEKIATLISATRREDNEILGGTDLKCMTPSALIWPGVPCCSSGAGRIGVNGDGLQTDHSTTQICNTQNLASTKKAKRKNRKANNSSAGNQTTLRAPDESINAEEYDKVIGLIHVAHVVGKTPRDMVEGFAEKLEQRGMDTQAFRAAVKTLIG